MKAKMSKPAEPGKYFCLCCGHSTLVVRGILECRSCRSADRSGLIPIYMEDNPFEDDFYSPVDWHGG